MFCVIWLNAWMQYVPIYMPACWEFLTLVNLNLWKHIFSVSTISQHLTHWGRVTHICVSKRTIIDSDNGLSPGRRQAIIWINAGLLLIGPLGTNFSEILIRILTFSFKKMRLKVSSAKRRPFCLGLNVLNDAGGWNRSLWRMRTCLSFIIITIVADGHARQGAKASVATVLTYIFCNILGPDSI